MRNYASSLVVALIYTGGYLCTLVVGVMVVFLFSQGLQFDEPGRFWLSTTWNPTLKPLGLYGVWPLFAGSLWVTVLALALGVIPGLGIAIYLAELTGERARRRFKLILELIAAMPSVVLGFFGITALAPLVRSVFALNEGQTAFTGALLLALMALPIFITLSEDALRSVPSELKIASYGLGATHWQTIRYVLLPASFRGISAAFVLSAGRIVGETMVVLMVCGNSPIIPTSPFDSVRTMPAAIAAEIAETATGSRHYQALFLVGCVLFLLNFSLNLLFQYVRPEKPATFQHG
jgi:phosphate transport system permease protein